jgi:hypothetical protein
MPYSTLELQKKLKAAGFNPGPLDGIMGPKTQAALNKYYASGKATTTPAKTPTKTTTVVPAKPAVISPGTKSTTNSSSTLDLQKKLKAAGFDPGPTDGIMGPKTQAALDNYNKATAANSTKTATTGTKAGATSGTAANKTETKPWNAADYADNYTAEMNRIKATNPNDPRIAQLLELAKQKILSDPEKYAKYDSNNFIQKDALEKATAALMGRLGELQNFEENYAGQSEADFMAGITGKIDALLQEQRNTAEANAQKARMGILTDADIAKQEMNDAYTQQISELASQADKIRAAYASGKRGIEATKDKTLPTYDKAMNQQDILAQRQKKQLSDEFAQRGLSAGGQVASELSQNDQENLTKIGDISTGKQGYIADTSNKLADLEATQTGGLTDLARAESTAAQTLSSGKIAIIKKVNAALSNLTTDEQALLDNLAQKRTEMLYDASQQYKNQTQAEKDAAFDRMLKQAGVAQDAVGTIRGLIDDVNKAKTAALEAEIKQLQLQGLPKQLEQEAKLLAQQVEKGEIDLSIAKQELANLRAGKTRSGSVPSEEKEKPPTTNEIEAGLVTKLDGFKTDAERLSYIQSIKSEIIQYLGKAKYDSYVEEYGG